MDPYHRGQYPSAITERLGCSPQTVRDQSEMFIEPLHSMGLKDYALLDKEKELQHLRDRIYLLHSQCISSKEIAKLISKLQE